MLHIIVLKTLINALTLSKQIKIQFYFTDKTVISLTVYLSTFAENWRIASRQLVLKNWYLQMVIKIMETDIIMQC